MGPLQSWERPWAVTGRTLLTTHVLTLLVITAQPSVPVYDEAQASAYFVQLHRQPSTLGAVGAPLARQPGVTLRAVAGELATADLIGNVYVTASLVSISSENPGSLSSSLADLPPPPENPVLIGNQAHMSVRTVMLVVRRF